MGTVILSTLVSLDGRINGPNRLWSISRLLLETLESGKWLRCRWWRSSSSGLVHGQWDLAQAEAHTDK